MKKVAVIGSNGYVGNAFVEFFSSKYDVYGCDLNEDSSLSVTYSSPKGTQSDGTEFPEYTGEELKNHINASCDVGVVCVPTPPNESNECDTSIVEDVIQWLDTPIILIKSTISPGTTEYLCKKYNKTIIFSPEYAGESSYWTPYKFHSNVVETPFFIFGGDAGACDKLVDMYIPIAGPTKRYMKCKSIEAELAKYVENTFYATKVTFFNEIFDICEKSDTTWNTVRELFLLDPRVNPMHTMVLKDNRGFAGKCYPKDLNALIQYAEKIGVNPSLLKSVDSTNTKIREENE